MTKTQIDAASQNMHHEATELWLQASEAHADGDFEHRDQCMVKYDIANEKARLWDSLA